MDVQILHLEQDRSVRSRRRPRVLFQLGLDDVQV